jgi:divinyl protochlorophyllide a 8-vinyl-reductase
MAFAELNDPAGLAQREAAGRIGPNAVLQLAEVLLEQDGSEARARVFRRAGLIRHLASPPSQMVEEQEVARLFGALREELGQAVALKRLADAGARTAAYLLSHRIPPFARVLLPNMPASFAAVLLTRSIQRHGWTFLGSGSLEVVRGNPLGIRIRLAPSLLPVSRLAGEFYRATFEGLFRALVDPEARAAPEPAAAGICRFDILW